MDSSITSTCSSTDSYFCFISEYRELASLSSAPASSIFSSKASICSWMRAVSRRNILMSYVLSSSFFFKNSLAFSDCLSKGPICFSSSARISLTRRRFWRSSSSFFTDMFFRRLNLTIPAASSKSSLLSSGFPLRILSIWPWPMIEYPSFPMPVS